MAGDLVAFPTETVYGLGADACNSQAVGRIYAAKGRPVDHPLIVHIPSIAGMDDWVRDVPVYAITLGRTFWPGPMTLVLRRSEIAGDFVTGGQDTIAVRIPDHAVALALLQAFERVGGKGVAAPSANRFGHVSPTSATAVIEELGEFLSVNDVVLDGGSCAVGVNDY
jgi:L-threonylcarbamoyladenylate synthase